MKILLSMFLSLSLSLGFGAKSALASLLIDEKKAPLPLDETELLPPDSLTWLLPPPSDLRTFRLALSSIETASDLKTPDLKPAYPSLIAHIFGKAPCALILNKETLSSQAIDPKKLKEALFSKSQKEPSNKNFSLFEKRESFEVCSKETTALTLSSLTSQSHPVQTAGPPLVVWGVSYYAYCSLVGFGIDRADVFNRGGYGNDYSGSVLFAGTALFMCFPVTSLNKTLRWALFGDREFWSPYYWD